MSVGDGYLLDTNVISRLCRPQDPEFPQLEAKMKALGNAPVFLPVIAIAEIEFGMAKAVGINQQQRDAVRAFFQQFPLHLGIDDDTIEPYSLIRSQLWRTFATPLKRGHKEALPEDLSDRVTGKSLGIDERDLLIASVAVQYNLNLATGDSNQGMQRIAQAAAELQAHGHQIELRIAKW